MKKLQFIFIILSALLILGCSTAYKSLTVTTPDLALVNDGVYKGHYNMSSTPVKVTLNVTSLDHKISKIDILDHTSSPIGKKAEKIIDTILEKQSLEVDVISGATVSSKAILKAVENAFQ